MNHCFIITVQWKWSTEFGLRTPSQFYKGLKVKGPFSDLNLIIISFLWLQLLFNCPFYWPFCDWICHATFRRRDGQKVTKSVELKGVDDYFAFFHNSISGVIPTFFGSWIWIHHPWLGLALLLHITDINNSELYF